MINELEVDSALQAILINKEGHHAMECSFTELSSVASLGNMALPKMDFMKRGALKDKVHAIADNFSQIGFLLFRIKWVKDLARNNAYVESFWSQSVGIDIEKIFLNLRTMMDHWAVVISLTNGSLGGSYHDLLQWSEKESNASRIDSDLRKLILESKDWFMALKYARENVTHHGAMTLVFGDPSNPVEIDFIHGEGNRVEEHEKLEAESMERTKEWLKEIIKSPEEFKRAISFFETANKQMQKQVASLRKPVRMHEVKDYKELKKSLERLSPLIKGNFVNTIDFETYFSYFIVKAINFANDISKYCLVHFKPQSTGGTNPQFIFTLQPIVQSLYSLKARVKSLEVN